MSAPDRDCDYVNAEQLSALSNLSVSTIWRLKRDGRIPFYQPAGPGGAARFPRDAIERGASAEPAATKPPRPSENAPERLAGPTPKWMKNQKTN
jgi:hypothetical protein